MRRFTASTARMIAALAMVFAMVPGVAAADDAYFTSQAPMLVLSDDVPEGAWLVPIVPIAARAAVAS